MCVDISKKYKLKLDDEESPIPTEETEKPYKRCCDNKNGMRLNKEGKKELMRKLRLGKNPWVR